MLGNGICSAFPSLSDVENNLVMINISPDDVQHLTPTELVDHFTSPAYYVSAV